jgi:hypothetical protein
VKRALWSCAACLSLACYAYVPTSLDAVPAGTAVRAVLSTEAQLVLRDSLGLRQQTVQGTLAERDGDRVLLAIRAEGGDWRAGSHALYQRVALAPRDVLQVEVKRLRRGRTVGLLVGIAAAATVVAIEAVARGNPGTPEPPGGGPPERLVGW